MDRKNHGHRFLGFASHHLHRLFEEGKDNHGAVLWWFMGRFEAELMKNGPIALSPWQCTSSLICNCHSKTGRITLQIAASSTLFSRFGTMRFLFVPKHKKMAWWKAIHVKRRNRGLFCGVRQTILKKLEYRCTKCIELNEDYIEK